MAYKKVYLGVLGLLGLFAMIFPFIESYSDYSDITCGKECWTTFCMKNGVKTLYFYNKESVPLSFGNDAVHNVEFYEKKGSAYKRIDFVSSYKKGVSYVFKIAPAVKTCYGIKVFKDAETTVKWTFAGLDPIFYGVRANLSYVVNPVLNGNISQNWMPNWSKAWALINWTNPRVINGTFSWQFSQKNVSKYPANASYVYNLTNIGLTNITVYAKFVGANDKLDVWFLNASQFKKWNLTNSSWTTLFNLTSGQKKKVNMTIDLFKLNQTYSLWNLTSDKSNFSFGISFNASVV